jgi:ABC-type transporter Mla subunit MlaD
MVASVFSLPGIGDIGDALGMIGDLVHGASHAHLIATAGDAAHAVTQAVTLGADHLPHVATVAAHAQPLFEGLGHLPSAIGPVVNILHEAPAAQAQTLTHLATLLQATPEHAQLAASVHALANSFTTTHAIDIKQLHDVLGQVLHNAPEVLQKVAMIRFGGS